MIHTKHDFFDQLATEIRSTYFTTENHGTTHNINYHKTTQTIELFNNGCLTYRQLIGRLSKSCNDSTFQLHKIVEKYIVSFGSYQYKPKN